MDRDPTLPDYDWLVRYLTSLDEQLSRTQAELAIAIAAVKAMKEHVGNRRGWQEGYPAS